MNWEFLNKAPPWLVVFVLILMSGSGGAGVFSLIKPDPELHRTLNKINTTQEKIVDRLEALERRNENHSWRLDSHSDRLNGHATKNREQDKQIRDIDRTVTRMEARSEP